MSTMLRRFSSGVASLTRQTSEKKPKEAKEPKATVSISKVPAPAAAQPPPPPEEEKPKRVWRATKDPKTGRTYYYDVLTRETQWTKPRELQDAAEREALDAKEAEKRAFFDEMERNMRANLANGLSSADVATPTQGLCWKPPAARPSSGSIGGFDDPFGGRVRTLSTVDDSFLEDDSSGRSRASRRRASQRRRSLSPQTAAWWGEVQSAKGKGRANRGERAVSFADEKDALRAFAAGERARAPQKPQLARTRNSTGTMFVASTLDKPDRDATIQCVCHVLRAHMAAAKASPAREREKRAREKDFKVFEDADLRGDDATLEPPTASRLTAFYRDVFSRGQMETECIVTSLIYVERLLKAGRGKIKLRPRNWRPILLSCMIMASKVCDDLSMWNADFSHICASFTLKRINDLEAALLKAYGFNATVPASEYAKYYFHLRSMAARLGIDIASAPKPLDVAAARGVATRSRRTFTGPEAASAKELAASLGDLKVAKARRAQSVGGQDDYSRQATLEEVVDMDPKNSGST